MPPLGKIARAFANLERLTTRSESRHTSVPAKGNPDPLWETLVDLLGEPVTASERGRRNKALKELREAGATPRDVHTRAGIYRAKWPHLDLTATALAANWSSLKPPPSRYETWSSLDDAEASASLCDHGLVPTRCETCSKVNKQRIRGLIESIERKGEGEQA